MQAFIQVAEKTGNNKYLIMQAMLIQWLMKMAQLRLMIWNGTTLTISTLEKYCFLSIKTENPKYLAIQLLKAKWKRTRGFQTVDFGTKIYPHQVWLDGSIWLALFW